MEQSVNQFTKGMQTDIHPMTQGSDSLSSCLNGTLVTQNGNEFVLQNDMGNAKLENVHLPDGFEPVGIVEHGGVIYVASYNPITNLSQIGSFPSPQRIFENVEEENLSTNEIDLNEFLNEENLYRDEHGLTYLKNTSYLYPISQKYTLHAGDKFHLFAVNDNGEFNKVILDNNNLSNYNNVSSNNEIINKYNDRYSLYFGVLDSKNQFHDYTKSLKRYKDGEMIDSTKNSQLDYNIGYFLDTYSNLSISDDKTKSNIYLERLTGYPCIKSEINVVDSVNYNVDIQSSEINLEIEEQLLAKYSNKIFGIYSEYLWILYCLKNSNDSITKPQDYNEIDKIYVDLKDNSKVSTNIDDYFTTPIKYGESYYDRVKFTDFNSQNLSNYYLETSNRIGYIIDQSKIGSEEYRDYNWYEIPESGPIGVGAPLYIIQENDEDIEISNNLFKKNILKENLTTWQPIDKDYYIKYNESGNLVYGVGRNTIKLNFTINYECFCNCPLLNNENWIDFPKLSIYGYEVTDDEDENHLKEIDLTVEDGTHTITEFGNDQYRLKASIKYKEVEYYLTPELKYMLYFKEHITEYKSPLDITVKNSYFEQTLYKFYDIYIKSYDGLINYWRYKYENNKINLDLNLSYLTSAEGNYKIKYQITTLSGELLDKDIISESYEFKEDSVKTINESLEFESLDPGEFYYLNIYLLDEQGNKVLYTLSKNEIWILTTTLFNSDYENNTNFQNIKEKEIEITPNFSGNLKLYQEINENNNIVNEQIFGDYSNIPVSEKENTTGTLSAKYEQLTSEFTYNVSSIDNLQLPISIESKIKEKASPIITYSGFTNIQSIKKEDDKITHNFYYTKNENLLLNDRISIQVPVIKSLYKMINDNESIICNDEFAVFEIKRGSGNLVMFFDSDLYGQYKEESEEYISPSDCIGTYNENQYILDPNKFKELYQSFNNQGLNNYYFVIGMSVNDMWCRTFNTNYNNFYVCHFQYAPNKWMPLLIQGFNKERENVTKEEIKSNLKSTILNYCNPCFYSNDTNMQIYAPKNFSNQEVRTIKYEMYNNSDYIEDKTYPVTFKITIKSSSNKCENNYTLITNNINKSDIENSYMLVDVLTKQSTSSYLTKKIETYKTDIFKYNSSNKSLTSINKLDALTNKLNLDYNKLSKINLKTFYQYDVSHSSGINDGPYRRYNYNNISILGESNNKDYISR